MTRPPHRARRSHQPDRFTLPGTPTPARVSHHQPIRPHEVSVHHVHHARPPRSPVPHPGRRRRPGHGGRRAAGAADRRRDPEEGRLSLQRVRRHGVRLAAEDRLPDLHQRGGRRHPAGRLRPERLARPQAGPRARGDVPRHRRRRQGRHLHHLRDHGQPARRGLGRQHAHAVRDASAEPDRLPRRQRHRRRQPAGGPHHRPRLRPRLPRRRPHHQRHPHGDRRLDLHRGRRLRRGQGDRQGRRQPGHARRRHRARAPRRHRHGARHLEHAQHPRGRGQPDPGDLHPRQHQRRRRLERPPQLRPLRREHGLPHPVPQLRRRDHPDHDRLRRRLAGRRGVHRRTGPAQGLGLRLLQRRVGPRRDRPAPADPGGRDLQGGHQAAREDGAPDRHGRGRVRTPVPGELGRRHLHLHLAERRLHRAADAQGRQARGAPSGGQARREGAGRPDRLAERRAALRRAARTAGARRQAGRRRGPARARRL